MKSTCVVVVGVLLSTLAMAAEPLGFVRLRPFGFPNSSAQFPQGAPCLASDGHLYVTALYGGLHWEGAVFRVHTDGSGHQIIHSFGATNDGIRPYAGLIEGRDGALYGTTWGGGTNGNGIVFKVRKDGAGYTVLRYFEAENAGQPPSELFQAPDGLLYGTTFNGGDHGFGVVFRIATNGGMFQVIKHFGSVGGDGENPLAGVIQATDGRLYGTTGNGGAYDAGTVYSMFPDGSDYRVLVSLGSTATDGRSPYGTLCEARHGMLYGTTRFGGGSGRGTIFRLDKTGTNYARLASFGTTGPSSPECTLIQGQDGYLYGMNARGGTGGGGSIFRFSTNASLSFSSIKLLGTGATDAREPNAGLVQGWDGTLFGAGEEGGNEGSGVFFRINPDGSGYANLFSCLFTGGDGRLAQAPMIRGSDGRLYGTSSYGGTFGLGTVYRVDTNGSNYTILHSFERTGDGASPYGPVVEGTDGRLYGTTVYFGGVPNGYGCVYGLNKDGSGYAVLYQFQAPPADGNPAWGGLIEGSDGRLYGATASAGMYWAGTVFRLDKNGANFETIFHFTNTTGSAQSPRGDLIEGPDGAMYGTTFFGGAHGSGTFFKLGKDGNGHAVLHSFSGGNPRAGVSLASDGLLYGTAYNQGAGGDYVYRIDWAGTNFAILKSLYGADGSNVYAGVVEGPDGALYGTAERGGEGDRGTVYRLTRDGGEFKVLFSFREADVNGAFPAGGLVRSGDALYGATAQGGEYVSGTLFKIAAPRSGEIQLSLTIAPSPELRLSAPLGITYRIESTSALPGTWSLLTNMFLDRGPGTVGISMKPEQAYLRAVVE